MTAPASAPEFPPALADDHDDVAWALQTGVVQWNRGGYEDGLVWLKRAVDAALENGQYDRASELTRVTDVLEDFVEDRPPQRGEEAPLASVSGGDDIDDLLDGRPSLPEVEIGAFEFATQSLVDANELMGADGPTDTDIRLPYAFDAEDAPAESLDPDEIEVLDDEELEDLSEEESGRKAATPPPPKAAAPPGPPPRRPPPPPPPRTVAPAAKSVGPSKPPEPQRTYPSPFDPPEPSEPALAERGGAPAAEPYAAGGVDETTHRRSVAAALAYVEEEVPTGVRAFIAEPSSEDEVVIAEPAFPPDEPAFPPYEPAFPPAEAADVEAAVDSEPVQSEPIQSTEIRPSVVPLAAVEEAPIVDEAVVDEAVVDEAVVDEAVVDEAVVEPPPLAAVAEFGDVTEVRSALIDDDDLDIPEVLGDEVATDNEETPLVSGVTPSEPPAVDDGEPSLRGVKLAEVRGLEDLPPEIQAELVGRARIEVLGPEEEVSAFGLALVLKGSVSVMPAIADVACARAGVGDPVFCRGNLADGVAMRVVALGDGAEIAVWQVEDFETVMATCPWVAEELRTVADRFQALAGATMGPLGDSLDESMRALVTDRTEVKLLEAGEELLEAGKPLPGLHIVGAGRLEIDGGDEALPGDLLFAQLLLGGGSTPKSVRAGEQGALVLFVDRSSTHELMMSVPPLLEVLAGA